MNGQSRGMDELAEVARRERAHILAWDKQEQARIAEEATDTADAVAERRRIAAEIAEPTRTNVISMRRAL